MKKMRMYYFVGKIYDLINILIYSRCDGNIGLWVHLKELDDDEDDEDVDDFEEEVDELGVSDLICFCGVLNRS